MRRESFLGMALVLGGTAWAQTTIRVSLGNGGVQGNLSSYNSALSSDARWVAFSSDATNLVAGDTNARTDIFVHDRLSATTERVSVGPSGVQGDNYSSPNGLPVSITPDGRYVVFASDASNLVAGDTNALTDIFVRDRQLATTERVSLGAGGAQGNDGSRLARSAISSDGRYVAFSSLATNLVAGDTNGFEDVFVRDRLLGTTERVSLATGGAQTNQFNYVPTITSDGRYVAWASDATNLVAGDTNNAQDVFLRDRLAATTERVSVDSAGVQGNHVSSGPALSDDGRYVAFISLASNFVPGDVNGSYDIFLRDRQSAATELVSLDSNEIPANGIFGSYLATLSSDGRYVVFSSSASNLVPGDTNGAGDTFLRDRLAGTTERVSLTSSGGEVNGDSASGAITPDGRWVAFHTQASNVVPGDTNADLDVFLRDRLCAVSEIEIVSVDSTEVQGNSASGVSVAVSTDGRWVAFDSLASNFVSGDTNGFHDVFVRDRVAGTTEIVSVGQGGVTANGTSQIVAISADGRYVAFQSGATNLVPGDTNAQDDVFVRDRLTGTTERVSVDSAGNQAPLLSRLPAVSSDGRCVAFRSLAALVPADTNGTSNVYVRDRIAGTTDCVSVDSNGAIGNSPSDEPWDAPALSGDGRYVLFSSAASNLVPNDTNGLQDVFLHDRTTGTTERISVGPGGAQSNNNSGIVSISPDGRWIAFGSWASLVPNDTNGTFDVFLYDRLTTTIERVSLSSTGAEGNGPSYDRIDVSGDGRYVLFGGLATNLVPDDTNGTFDVFLRDRLLGTTARVSVGQYGVQANFGGWQGALSSDGLTVVFASQATNLVAVDANGTWFDVFAHTSPEQPGFTILCEPGANGVIACPCGNPPSTSGRGCNNSAATGGAKLAASGLPCLSMDSVIFTTSAELPSATSIVLQGSLPLGSGVPFGQGVRCVGGSLLRLYVKTASGGSISTPDLAGGQISVSARSAALGSTIQSGESRSYLVYYRDPVVLGGCPASSTFNATQTLRIHWGM